MNFPFQSHDWTILSEDPGQPLRYSCVCQCGTERSVLKRNIKRQTSKSCGFCGKIGEAPPFNGNPLKYGAIATRKIPEYAIWANARLRCSDKTTNPFHRTYLEKGIKMCERWANSFEAFQKDMGQRPSSEYSIDRIDNDGDYCPENCRWATWKQQARNKNNNHRLSFCGITATIAEWVEITGIKFTCIKKRLFLGWSIEKTLSSPVVSNPSNNPLQRIKDHIAAKNNP